MLSSLFSVRKTADILREKVVFCAGWSLWYIRIFCRHICQCKLFSCASKIWFSGILSYLKTLSKLNLFSVIMLHNFFSIFSHFVYFFSSFAGSCQLTAGKNININFFHGRDLTSSDRIITVAFTVSEILGNSILVTNCSIIYLKKISLKRSLDVYFDLSRIVKCGFF